VLPVFDSAIPISVIQGGAVSFRVQVFNEGLENAARFTVRLVVDCPSEGVRVIDKEFLGLGAGDGTIVGFTFGDETDPNDPTFPLPVGVCQLNVIVDPDNVIPENNELNNFLFAEGFGAQLTVEPRLADLLPAEILFDSPLRSTDLPTRISVRIVNQGGRPSGSFLTQLALCLHRTAFVFLSSCESDADFLSADTFQTRQVTNLDPGESRLVNFDFTNLAPGSYVIRASVDASSRQGGEVSESDETNNTLTLIPPLEILPPPANVRPTQVEYPITPIALGLAVPVVAQIVNAGGGFTTDFRVRFSYCRFDPTTNAFCNDPSAFTQFPDTLGSLGQTLDFGVVMVNGIPANTTVRVPTTLLTADLQPGNYVLRVEADIDNVLLESDETDNILVTQAPLLLQGQDQGTNAGDGQSPPSGQSEADLVITNFELDKSLVPEGTRFKFNFTVFNQGVQDAGAFTVKVFYQKIGNQDVKFDSTRIEFLGQKQSLTLESTLNTEGLEPGRYKIIVIVDTFNEIQESFEANNRQERWLRVI